MNDQPIKRFSSPAPADDAPPIPFELAVFRYRTELIPDDEGGDGKKLRRVRGEDGREIREDVIETFHARPDVSGGALVQVDLMGGGANRGSNARGGDALYDFFDAFLVPEDVKRFRTLIEDEHVYVHAKVLSEIAVHFYSHYTARPTRAPGS